MKAVSSLFVVGWLCTSGNAWITLPTSRPALYGRLATRTLPLPDGRYVFFFFSFSSFRDIVCWSPHSDTTPRRTTSLMCTGESTTIYFFCFLIFLFATYSAPYRNLALYASVETSSPRRRNDNNNNDSNNNDRPRRSFGNKSTFGNRNSNNNNNNDRRGAGGDRRPFNNNGSPALTLSNPLKLQRVVDQIPLSEMGDQPSGPRQVASASDNRRGNNGRPSGGPGGRRPGPDRGGDTAVVTSKFSAFCGIHNKPTYHRHISKNSLHFFDVPSLRNSRCSVSRNG